MGDAVIPAEADPDPRRAMTPQVPVRTCLGCRRKEERSSLLRLVADPSTPTADARVVVRPDPGARLPGRGAWIHPTPACLDQAVRRRAVGRALRVTARIDLGQVHSYVTPVVVESEDAGRGAREGALHDRRQDVGGPQKNRKRV